MRTVRTATREAKIKAGNYMEGGLKRLGALFLKVWAVPMVSVGLGLMLWGLFSKLEQRQWEDPLSAGVALVVLGGVLWVLARKLDSSAQLLRYRRQQNAIVRLGQERGGRLTATETAADTGLTMEEAEEILVRLADGGFVEIEITESGMVVYRFPEILLAHEKPWSRGVDSA
jgi:hypothetical protein